MSRWFFFYPQLHRFFCFLLQPTPPTTKDSRSSSSSSSGLSSSASSSEDEDPSKKAKPTPRVHPVPQKRPQILLAKPDHKKKRGRKPLHPDLKALRQAKSKLPPLSPPPPPPSPSPSSLPPPGLAAPQRHHPSVRPSREELRAGVKKPLQPASFTYTGLGRTSRNEASSASNSAFVQSVSPKPGALSCAWTNRSLSSPSPGSSHKATPSAQSKHMTSELKSSSRSDGFKTSPLKHGSGTSGSGSLHGTFDRAAISQRSQSNQRRQDGVSAQTGSGQHKQIPQISSPRDRANQALSLRALNLQSVSRPTCGAVFQGNNTGGAAVSRSSSRSSGIMVKSGVKDGRPSSCGQRSGTNMVVGEHIRGKEVTPGGGASRGNGSSANRSLNELSTGDSDETSSSESEQGVPLYPAANSRPSLGSSTADSDTETDWRPARSLLEHVFVTDVTANFITVTVKESPTSVGFFNSLNH